MSLVLIHKITASDHNLYKKCALYVHSIFFYFNINMVKMLTSKKENALNLFRFKFNNIGQIQFLIKHSYAILEIILF